MQRAVIYCRCSTEEESQADALKKQAAEARECVERMQWQLVDEYVESKSGTTSKGRREYRRLFDDIPKDCFDIVVIKSQDRLMRNTKDWYLFLDRLQTCKKQLYLYLEGRFYSAEDSLLSGIKAILAEEYSRELSKKMINAHKHRQKNGGRLLLTNQTFGFKKQPDGSVRVVEEEAQILRRIYAYCADGYGSRAIAAMLKKEGVRSKNGNFMTPGTIRRMIRNPLYKGVFVMNRRHFDFETKRTAENPREEWILKEGAVPVIIDEALWERANEAMSARTVRGGEDKVRICGRKRGNHVLSGKLICGNCKAPYYRTARREAGEPGRVRYEWKCSRCLNDGRMAGKTGDIGCTNSHLDEETVLDVIGRLCAESRGTGEKERLIGRTLELLGAMWGEDTGREGESRSERSRSLWREKKERLLDKLLAGVISDTDFRLYNERLEAERADLERAEARLRAGLQGGRKAQQDEHRQLGSAAVRLGQSEAPFRQGEGRQPRDTAVRLEQIRAELMQGGFERAEAGRLLKMVKSVIVHEWELEVCLPDSTVFLKYPFPPGTEKGRFLDRQSILEALRKEPSLTAGELAERMGRSRFVIQNRRSELVRAGLLRFEGRGGHGSWRITKKQEETVRMSPGGGMDSWPNDGKAGGNADFLGNDG